MTKKNVLGFLLPNHHHLEVCFLKSLEFWAHLEKNTPKKTETLGIPENKKPRTQNSLNQSDQVTKLISHIDYQDSLPVAQKEFQIVRALEARLDLSISIPGTQHIK